MGMALMRPVAGGDPILLPSQQPLRPSLNMAQAGPKIVVSSHERQNCGDPQTDYANISC